MKLKITISIIFLLLLVGCKKDNPALSFEHTTIDIGEVNPDTIITVVFKPKNIGKALLKINRVTSDCHCTVARNFQKEIKPEQEGEIKVSYHSKGLGYFEQLIEVYSNDNNNSPALLILKGRVKLKK